MAAQTASVTSFMLYELEEDAFLLAYTMGNISELGWSASWMRHLEYVLWHAVTNGPRAWGRTVVNADDIRVLRLLSERIGGWIYLDDEHEESYIPLADWQRTFAQAVQQHPEILW